MKIFRVIFLLVAVLAWPSALMAQRYQVNPKFGAVSEDEVRMSVYEPDTSAVAVYLNYEQKNEMYYRGGKFSYYELVTVNTRRIKILKEAGKNLANFEFLYNTDIVPSDSYSSIKVVTYNWEDGQIVQSKMDRSSIYDTKLVSGLHKVSFAADNVKVGSVVEVTWQTGTNCYNQMPDLLLQFQIPVNRGEFVSSYSNAFKFRIETKGHDLRFMTYRNEVLTNRTYDTYTVMNMPAFKLEPKIIGAADFITSVGYYLHHYERAGVNRYDFNTNWEWVDGELAKTDAFKCIFSPCRFKAEMDEILSSNPDDQTLIREVRKMVTSKVKWNNKYRQNIYNLNSAIKAGTGSSADINALVGNCLRSAGLIVCPVYLKLRTSGTISQKIDQREYDCFILLVYDRSGNHYFFNPADDSGYLNVLDYNLLVARARGIREDGVGAWLDLSTVSNSSEKYIVDMKMDEGGQFVYDVRLLCRNDASAAYKDMYNGFDKEEEFIDAYEKALDGLHVESCEFSGVKDWSSEFRMNMHLTNDSLYSSDLMQFSPYIMKFFTNDAFKLEERRFPMEFQFADHYSYAFRLTLPEGYELVHAPSSESFRSDVMESAVMVSCQQPDERTLILNMVFNRKANMILPEQYVDAKAYWNNLSKIFDEQIIIKRQ